MWVSERLFQSVAVVFLWVSILIWLDVGFGVGFRSAPESRYPWFQSLFDWMWVSEPVCGPESLQCTAVSILIWLDVGFGELWTCGGLRLWWVSILIWLDVGFGARRLPFKSLPIMRFNPYLTGCGFRRMSIQFLKVSWQSFNPYLTGCGFRRTRAHRWRRSRTVFQSLFDWMWVSEGGASYPWSHGWVVSILIWLDVGFGVRSARSSLAAQSGFNPYLTGCGFRSQVQAQVNKQYLMFQSLFDWMWVSECG